MNGSFALDKANAKLWGVCAGLARYANIDTTWVRIAFVVATLIGFGSPVLLYIIVGLVAPAA
ncbi:hypothetical protein IP88_06815 [alpha proteobacterium AAP81b]|nr:hypothetical protein IP88_06815 [alpha proteobacterium AAP81b]